MCDFFRSWLNLAHEFCLSRRVLSLGRRRGAVAKRLTFLCAGAAAAGHKWPHSLPLGGQRNEHPPDARVALVDDLVLQREI
jgi:hypothetical protein